MQSRAINTSVLISMVIKSLIASYNIFTKTTLIILCETLIRGYNNFFQTILYSNLQHYELVLIKIKH